MRFRWGWALGAGVLTAAGAACGSPLEPASAESEWVSVTMGDGHGCLLDADGRPACFGSNRRGQLGLGTAQQPSEPVVLETSLRFAAIDAGAFHSCAVTFDGLVWCWGANESGQLGLPDLDDRTFPVQVPLEGGPWVEVSAGYAHSCAVREDGIGVCWGRNARGQLGRGDVDPGPFTPSALEGRWSSLSAGGGHTCGVATDGRGLCWGDNRFGQLGTGVASSTTAPGVVAGAVDWGYIRASDDFSCGRSRSGEAFCWGGAGAGFPVPDAGPGVGTPERIASLVRGVWVGPEVVCLTGTEQTDCVDPEGSLRLPDPTPVVALAASRSDICFLSGAGRLACAPVEALRQR